MDAQELLNKAKAAREFAYAPYSDFAVGAAVVCDDGSVFTGCNVENASFGGTICAERCAALKAVSFGYIHFTAVAVVGGRKGEKLVNTPPCGICRQFLSEFCDENTTVYIGTGEDEYREEKFGELLPLAFTL